MERLTWEEICRRTDCRGRWVALHACRFDESTGEPTEGEVVDIDDDLAELCQRVRAQHITACAIQYCQAS